MNNNTLKNIEIIKDGRGFTLNFKVMYKESKPVIKFDKVPDARYNMPSWNTLDKVNKKDELLPHEWETEASNANDFTFDYFKAGEIIDVTIENASFDGELNVFEDNKFTLEVIVNTIESGEYVITYNFSPKVNGWFSIGYTGAPQEAFENIEAIWQPMVWLDKCFPVESYLTTEFNCPVPTTLVNIEGITYGVVVDPSKMQYRMPTAKNSRFGVMVKNKEQKAQPIVFAPVLGGEESYMEVGTSFGFKVRLIARNEKWLDTFEYIARKIYGFRDYRKNVGCSLTETMFNMIDYAMNHYYSNWNEELKGCSYHTDVPGSVKNVSALHMLGIAYTTDNVDIIEKRALPAIEYLMSREKLLFAMDEEIKGQGASHFLKGPCVTISELSSLHSMFYGQTPVFMKEALNQFNKPVSDTGFNAVGRSSQLGHTFQNTLAIYRMTRDKKYLNEAIELAKEYIANNVNEGKKEIENYCEFWTDYVPRFAELVELYEETEDGIFLEAAHKSARRYCSFIWYCPQIPDEQVTVNEGGKTSKYWYARGPEQMSIPEEKVPAWRVSEIGLNCEASATGHGHRGVFMAFFAPYLMRIARYTGDQFLHDTARSAIIGRYTNFPGYHMNTQRTTVYEKFDYPYHEFEELTYNTFHYNHIWPHISMLMDYLITEAICRSESRISFPSQYSECFVYMNSRVYGDRPGSFYGENDVWLWMPKDILKTGNEQINFITARGNGKLYAVFTNQSDKAVDTNIYLNNSIVPFEKSGTNEVTVWQQNHESGKTTMKCGVLPIHVDAKGITAVAIEGIDIAAHVQEVVKNTGDMVVSDRSYTCIETDFGRVTAMIISLGENYINNMYVWLTATEKVLKESNLYYVLKDKEHKKVDSSYPFEFTVPLGKNTEVEFWVEGLTVSGEFVKSDIRKLVKI